MNEEQRNKMIDFLQVRAQLQGIFCMVEGKAEWRNHGISVPLNDTQLAEIYHAIVARSKTHDAYLLAYSKSTAVIMKNIDTKITKLYGNIKQQQEDSE